MPFITKAKTYKTQMKHIVKYALKSRRLGSLEDVVSVDDETDKYNSITITVRRSGTYIIYYEGTPVENGRTRINIAVSDGYMWINVD